MKNRVINRLTILSDLVLINLAFWLAYVARYDWEWLRPVSFSEPYSDYLGQQLLLTVLLASYLLLHRRLAAAARRILAGGGGAGRHSDGRGHHA